MSHAWQPAATLEDTISVFYRLHSIWAVLMNKSSILILLESCMCLYHTLLDVSKNQKDCTAKPLKKKKKDLKNAAAFR